MTPPLHRLPGWAKQSFALVSALACSLSLTHAQLTINEFMASNGATIADEEGKFEDWIEVYNAGPTDVDLAGYYLGDDPAALLDWRIPAASPALTTVPAGGFLLLWADGDEDDGANHLDFKLSSGGETITLVAPDGLTVVDQYTYGVQVRDVSTGRTPDGAAAWDLFGVPTPGAANSTDPGAPAADAPTFSVRGGFHAGAVAVELATVTEDAVVHYTTDGSEPTAESPAYTGALTLAANTPLRARAILSPLRPSPVATETYLFDPRPTFPVVSYVADPTELFDPATGMYVNFGDDIEIEANVELYEPDGTRGFNQRVETEIQGTGSAEFPQKSLALKAKKSLGSATFDYRVFPDHEDDEYRSLVLRNSGQDYQVTMFRDALISELALDVSDVNDGAERIAPPEVLGQRYRPTVVYLNGAYWGIYNLRERMDRRYIEARFGLDRDEVDLLENDAEVKEGDLEAWGEITDYLRDNDLGDDGALAFVADRIDLDQYIDYVAHQVYMDNRDWPGNNQRRFRERDEGEPFRYLTYDLDFSFGLFTPGRPWNSGFNDGNALSRLLSDNGFRQPNPTWSTLLPRRLFANDDFRADFVNRLADQLNLLYADARVIGRIDALEAIYTPEIPRFQARRGFRPWERNVDVLRTFARGRTDNVREHVAAEFHDIDAAVDVGVATSDPDRGGVTFSTVNVGEAGATFVGKYFTGVDIPVRARPKRGFVLANWSGALTSSEVDATVRLTGPATLTANFAPGSASAAGVVVNEINYNSPDSPDPGDWVELHNPTADAVDVSGWYFEDESGDFFGLPANTILAPGGFLVLAADRARFSSVFPGVTALLGDFGADPGGFGLSGKGERVTLFNAVGAVIDEVEYDDKAPWPTGPDGDGPTLQLTDAALDNALAGSWKSAEATPGAANVEDVRQDQTIAFDALADRLTTAPPATLTATASSGLAVTLAVVSGPATLAGETLSLTGEPGTVTVRATQSGDADFRAAAPVTRSFAVRRPTPPPPPPPTAGYCAASGVAPWVEWIGRVQFGDIDRASGKSKYADYSDASTAVASGVSTPLTLTVAYSWETFDEHLAVWIDYNRDQIFDPVTELAFSSVVAGAPNGTKSVTSAGAITVPAGTPSGKTRMRVAMRRGAAPEPCGAFDRGEVEDYSVDIGGPAGPALTLVGCPADITVEAAVGATAAGVTWATPTATTTCPQGGTVVVQTSGPASGTNFDIGTATVAYAATDACGLTQTCSFTVTVLPAPTGPVSYCALTSDFPWHEYLSRVVVGDLDGASGKSRYSDFTASAAVIGASQTVDVTLETSFSWATAAQGYRIWIDYDGDGVFGAGEVAFETTLSPPPNGTPTAEVSGSLTVPAGVAPGRKRMRVAMLRGGLPEACGTLAFGEVEDYSVEVVPGPQARPLPIGGSEIGPTIGIGVFPNPASAAAVITVAEAVTGEVAVVNAASQVVARFPVAEGQYEYELPVAGYPTGTYTVSAIGAGGQVVSQVFVVRR